MSFLASRLLGRVPRRSPDGPRTQGDCISRCVMIMLDGQ
jgi:hypothetical protein